MRKESVISTLINEENILIVQDLDGVCIPLVQDPLKREISKEYVEAASKLKGKFSVLTCGEHEGKRGVNRLVERALKSKNKAKEQGLYLPGLAACGVEFQDIFGNMSYPGLKDIEINFLSIVPAKMKSMLSHELDIILPNLSRNEKHKLIDVAICDTRFTPTLNLNGIFSYVENDFEKIKILQSMMHRIMNNLLKEAKEFGLKNSFYLHMMPNLGIRDGEEIMKNATVNDYGTTDIQFIIKGAIKEAGLLVILNNYISSKTGIYPFGENFNVRNAPKTLDGLLMLCKEKISDDQMPLIIGVGDTVTSVKDIQSNSWLRGGSDRGFLTLIQKLGLAYQKKNQVIFVNSCNHEVSRPRIKDSEMKGISDPDDYLNFNMIIHDGPDEYIEWFKQLSNNFRND